MRRTRGGDALIIAQALNHIGWYRRRNVLYCRDEYGRWLCAPMLADGRPDPDQTGLLAHCLSGEALDHTIRWLEEQEERRIRAAEN